MFSDIKNFAHTGLGHLRQAFYLSAIGIENVFESLKQSWHRTVGLFGIQSSGVFAEMALLEEGVLHIQEAPKELQQDIGRNAATCAVETGLALIDNVALEATIAIASVEAVEKAIDSPAGQTSFREITADFAESVASSTMAALHSAINIFHDVEDAGRLWHARHNAYNALSFAKVPVQPAYMRHP